MTQTERRLKALETEIARLKAKQEIQEQSYYEIARERCKKRWETVKDLWSDCGTFNDCMEISRSAFKTKRNCCRCRYQPRQYITSMAEVEEFCSLFDQFMMVYANYQREALRTW